MCHCFHGKVVVCDHGRAMIAELNCKTWSCPDCGPKRREGWRQRLEALSKMDTAFERTVCSTKLEFRALVARLRRAGCEFVKAITAAGYEVFHQAFRGNRQTDSDPSRWMGADEMLEAATAVLDRLKHQQGVRCMTASAGVPYGERPVKSGWTVAARTGLSIEEMNRRVQASGYQRVLRPGKMFSSDMIPALVGDGFELSPLLCKEILCKQQRIAATTVSVELSKSAIF